MPESGKFRQKRKRSDRKKVPELSRLANLFRISKKYKLSIYQSYPTYPTYPSYPSVSQQIYSGFVTKDKTVIQIFQFHHLIQVSQDIQYFQVIQVNPDHSSYLSYPNSKHHVVQFI
jgi:hypothetical protein